MALNILVLLGIESSAIQDTKQCLYCNEEKHLCEFPKHKHNKDNLDSRCKECIKNQNKLRKKLLKSAPPKPDTCECCGKVPSKWVLDHDHKTNQFRGWLCDKCNTGIGSLGDNLDGLSRAVLYLQKSGNN